MITKYQLYNKINNNNNKYVSRGWEKTGKTNNLHAYSKIKIKIANVRLITHESLDALTMSSSYSIIICLYFFLTTLYTSYITLLIFFVLTISRLRH